MKLKTSDIFRTNRTTIYILASFVLGFVLAKSNGSSPQIGQFNNASLTEQGNFLSYSCPSTNELRQDAPFTTDSLEAYFGFRHNAFEQIVASRPMPMHYCSEECHVLKATCSIQPSAAYVAVFSDYELYVFRISAGEVVLVTSDTIGGMGWLPHTLGIGKIADRNFNQRLDIPVYGWNGGNCCLGEMKLLEIMPDGSFYDLTPETHSLLPTGLDDVNGDGIAEIAQTSLHFMPISTFTQSQAERFVLQRWWGWDGQAYTLVQVNAEGIASELDVRQRLNQWMTEGVCSQPISGYVFSREIFAILFYYSAWGNVDDGWDVLQPMLNTLHDCENFPSTQQEIFWYGIGELREYDSFFER